MQVTVFVILAFVMVLVGPALGIWAINTLSEQAGSDFYIQHSFWSYLAILVLGGLFRGGSK